MELYEFGIADVLGFNPVLTAPHKSDSHRRLPR